MEPVEAIVVGSSEMGTRGCWWMNMRFRGLIISHWQSSKLNSQNQLLSFFVFVIMSLKTNSDWYSLCIFYYLVYSYVFRFSSYVTPGRRLCPQSLAYLGWELFLYLQTHGNGNGIDPFRFEFTRFMSKRVILFLTYICLQSKMLL